MWGWKIELLIIQKKNQINKCSKVPVTPPLPATVATLSLIWFSVLVGDKAAVGNLVLARSITILYKLFNLICNCNTSLFQKNVEPAAEVGGGGDAPAQCRDAPAPRQGPANPRAQKEVC